MPSLKEIRTIGKEKFFFDEISNSANKVSKYQIIFLTLQSLPKYILEFGLVVAFLFLIPRLERFSLVSLSYKNNDIPNKIKTSRKKLPML